jgi:hypothetical protein
MTRAVIRFQDVDDGNGSIFFCLQSPGAKLSPLKCRPQDKEFLFDNAPDPEIAVAGKALRDSLLCHKDISSRLGVWLGMLDKEYMSLQLQLESAAADQLPWEALVDANDSFVALDARSPLSRVLPVDSPDRVRHEFVFVPPLRIACVLGAWWKEAGGLAEHRAEWDSLREGLAAAAAALPVAVHVYGCDPELEPELKANLPAGVTVEWSPITGNATSLLEEIGKFSPHILHLFAHCTTGDQPYLSLSTVADVAAESANPSILISPRDIRQVADRDGHVWTIALNCCDSAGRTTAGRHFAWQLIKFAFPAVIAMREPVKTTEARIVSRYFYEAALLALAQIPVGGRKEVDWAEFLQRVRLHLAGDPHSATKSKRWLIPVMYARTDPFQIIRGKPDVSETERVKLRSAREELIRQREEAMQLASIPPDLKEQLRAGFDEKIAEIDAKIV